MNFRDFYNNPPKQQKRNNTSFRDYRYFSVRVKEKEKKTAEDLMAQEQNPLNDVKSMNIHTGQSRFFNHNNSVYISPHNQSLYVPPQTKSIYIPPEISRNNSVYMPPPNPQRDRSVYMPQSNYTATPTKPPTPPPPPVNPKPQTIPEPPEIPLEIPPETPPPPIDPNVIRAMNPLPSSVRKNKTKTEIHTDAKLNGGFGAFGGTFDNNPNQTSFDDSPVFD